jgi:hypothetical protein
MASHIGRRKFLATLGGAAAAWPIGARAQQPAERMRHLGVLMSIENDPDGKAQLKRVGGAHSRVTVGAEEPR